MQTENATFGKMGAIFFNNEDESEQKEREP